MYEVKLKEVPKMLAVSVREISTMQAISADMGSMYQEVWDYITKNGFEWSGDTQCFALYHGECSPEKVDMECGFSVQNQMPEIGRLKCREIDGGLMASTFHVGSYSQLPAAYNAVMAWIKENGYEILSPCRDIYLNDPSTTPENELKTEILFPVKKI